MFCILIYQPYLIQLSYIWSESKEVTARVIRSIYILKFQDAIAKNIPI